MRVSAHGQCAAGAQCKKTGAGDYFKLFVKILKAIKSSF